MSKLDWGQFGAHNNESLANFKSELILNEEFKKIKKHYKATDVAIMMACKKRFSINRTKCGKIKKIRINFLDVATGLTIKLSKQY